MAESLAVLLLNAEGDKFNTSFLSEGVKGGETAAELVYSLAKEKVVMDNNRDGETKLVVYLVSDAHKITSSSQNKAFLKGFASTSNACFVVEPIKVDGTASASARILELLKTYLPLKSVSTILLGSLHVTDLYSYLRTLPSQYQSKITLVSTITVAPPYRVLVDSGTVEAWRGLERLFGGMSELPDLAALSLENDVGTPTRIDEVPDDFEEEPPESPSEEMIARLIWESSGSEHSGEDESSEEWELAAPRTTRKSPNGNIDSASPSHQGGRSYSSAAQTSPSIDQVVGNSRAAQQARPDAGLQPRSPRRERGGRQKAFSKTSGASRRRAQRERAAAAFQREQNQARLQELELTGEVSPLPAWRPPRVTFPEPHPCINHYLSKDRCTDRNCPYSHDYPFTEEEKRLYRPFIKSMICVKYLQGKCKKGESCLKGHRCPYTVRGCPFQEKCYYRTQGLPHSSPS